MICMMHKFPPKPALRQAAARGGKGVEGYISLTDAYNMQCGCVVVENLDTSHGHSPMLSVRPAWETKSALGISMVWVDVISLP